MLYDSKYYIVIKFLKVQVYQKSSIIRLRMCLLLLFSGLIFGLAHAQDLKLVDSLKLAFKKADARQRFEIQFALFREYRTSDQDIALGYARKALDQAMENADSLNIVKATHAVGHIFKNQSKYREAIRDYEYALAISKRNVQRNATFASQIKFLLNSLALAHTSNGSYDEALKYNFESLKIREAEGRALDVSVALNNIGLLYEAMGDNENALSYYYKSYQVKLDSGVFHDLDRSLINIGTMLNSVGKYNAGEEKLKEAFAILDSLKWPDILAQANQTLGTSVMKQDKFTEAEFYYKKSLLFYQKAGLMENVASLLNSMATLRYTQNRMDEALYYLNSSQETATKKLTLENYLLYAKIYSDKGDFKQASHYQDLYIQLNKEIFSGDLIKNIARIHSNYEERKNLSTIAEKDQILALNDQSILQQRRLNWMLIAVILLTSALVIVIFRNYQKIKTVNLALASAKRIIEVQNRLLDRQVQEKTKELIDANEELTKVNDELDNFIYKTSHDIRGPLASLKGMVNLAIMDVQDDKALGYLSKLDLTAEKLNKVLTRLLIVNRINHAELKPEPVSFENIIHEILTLEIKKGVPDKIRVEFEVAHDIQLISDKEMVRLVLENLIDNAIKFYNESERVESFVKILVESEDGTVVARVMDNGVGIAKMNRDKIFQMFVRASERSETGGIGLYLAKLATEKLGGDINLVSTDEKYTEFIVRFPHDLHAIIAKRKEEKHKQDLDKEHVVEQLNPAKSA